jgi:serine/threonine protein kinase
MLDGYRLDEQIGTGAMGVVYQAFDVKLGRTVALKVVSAVDRTGENVLRFIQEGAAAARIRHPNVVQVFSAGSQGDCAYLAMQLLDGETLATCLSREGQLPIHRAVDCILPLCSALMAAHDAGVLHRDLNPASIFLAKLERGEAEPYLLDFGIAKLDVRLEGNRAQDPRFWHSLCYIAPEQADGAPGSALSDQYSLALCLYACLLGESPFGQFKSSRTKLLRHISEGKIPSARSLDPSIPLGLDAVILRALSKHPRDRFESMQAFGSALLPFASALQYQLWHAAFLSAEEHSRVSARAPLGANPPRSAPLVRAELNESSSFDPGPCSSRRFNALGVATPQVEYSPPSLLVRVFFGLMGIGCLAMSVWLVAEEFRLHFGPGREADDAPLVTALPASPPFAQ